jgi:murein DD-endopeptidase MepM/ murein hydrolase activator NlpD
MPGRWRTALAGALLGALVLPLAAPAYAADRGDDPAARRRAVLAQLAASKGDVEQSSRAVSDAVAALQAVAVRLPRAQAHLADVSGRLSAARAGATATAASLAAARDGLAAAERDFATAQAGVEDTRRKAGELARAIYMTGPGGFAAVLFASGSPADLAARATYVHALLADGTGRVRAATDARADLASRAGVLAARRTDLARRDATARDALARVETLVSAARVAQADVAAQLTLRRHALAAAERERAADQARYRALVAESARLAEIVRRASTGTGRVGRGGLLWPTPGPVTSPFGWRMHPIYHVMRFHPGIDIGAPTGQPIVAALAGVVVSAGPMGTYGNIVVIDHGNGFATAYAHQSRILVRAGQHVARGERIGLVGSTGASTGPHLHFETRVNGTPVNPLNYF